MGMQKKINKMGAMMRLYKTRQQLQKLPDFILKDIGRTKAEITHELNKNNLLNLAVSHFRNLLKGG